MHYKREWVIVQNDEEAWNSEETQPGNLRNC